MKPQFIGSQYNITIPPSPKSLLRISASTNKIAAIGKQNSLIFSSELLINNITNNFLHFELKKCLPNRKLRLKTYHSNNDSRIQKSESHSLNLVPSNRKLQHRPSLRDIQNDQQLWTEFKCNTQLLANRAYHSAVYFDGKMFIFGGRDVERGSFNDIISFEISGKFTFSCEKIESTTPAPPALTGHSACVYQNYMYIFGGRISAIQNSSNLYRFDFFQSTWETLKSQTKIIPVDSHSACIFQNHYMLVFGGYSCETTNYLNSLQSYDFVSNSWQIVSQDEHNIPPPRSHHSATIINSQMWIFGGRNKSTLLNDLWKWDQTMGWTEIISSSDRIPSARLGHQIFCLDENYFCLFGGYSGLLKEKNDLWQFDITSESWQQLDRGYDFDTHKQDHEKRKRTLRRTTQRFTLVPDDKVNNSFSKWKENNSKSQLHEIKSQNNSAFKSLKKRQFLSPFQMSHDEERNLLKYTPTTRHLKQSIEFIEKTDLMKSTLKQKALLDLDQYNQIPKRPLARDGFSCIEIEQGWIIFGGDRHKVSFRDTWFLSKNLLNEIQLL